MGKKKAKSKRKSELRIIFFIILVAAALFIVSTYAWFSTQRNVSITNLKGTVEVAEGLEISLNAKTWANEIVLGDKDGQFNIIDSTTEFGPYEGHRNISPKEMLPVSTLGYVTESSTTMVDLPMIRGKITNSKELSKIVVMDETLALDADPEKHNSEATKYPGYFAFDIFLKNSSKQDIDDDILQLNYDSSLKIAEDGNDKVGLQNTVRVALAKYGTGKKGQDGTRAGVAGVMDDQKTILEQTGAVASGDDVYITDVAIWEPNSNDHVEYIVDNNNAITWSSSDGPKYGTLSATTGYYEFTTTTQMPTYAVKEAATKTTDAKIADIYKWNGTEQYLQQQVALQTTKTSDTDYSIKEGVQNLVSTTDASKATPFTIAPNSVIRLRVYVWLEGQDVDCINYASHGGGITLDLGLVKGSDPGDTEEDIEE